MKLKLISTLILALLLFGCTAPTPEADLAAAVAVLDVVSALPSLTTADKAWIATAASGLSCSSSVLAIGEPVAQEATSIAACFATLPVVPSGDQPYIQAGIAAVEVFIALFEPSPTPVAVAANARVAKMSAAARGKMAGIASVKEKVRVIRGRVGKS
jgi:hypothetical protein